MAHRIPTQWYQSLPSIWVIGDGAYSSALALVFHTTAFSLDALEAGPEADPDGKHPQVLGNLKWVFVVVSDKMSAAEALRYHDAAWHWVEKLAPAGEEHELAFVFILPTGNTDSLVCALAVGLGLRAFTPPYVGYAVWRSSEDLNSLLELLPQVRLCDLPPLRARLKAETKHAILSKLIDAASRGDTTLICEAANEVVREFSGSDYLLDVFCRHPSHRNGNMLRKWLHNVVTGSVTPDSNKDQQLLSQWLK